MIVCPKCKKEMGSLANFCNQCGTRLPPPPQPVDPAEQAELRIESSWEGKNFGICGQRGHFMQAAIVNAKFCAVCGVKFKFSK